MSQKFLINALIVAVVSVIFSNLGGYWQYVGCLVAIGLTIFMYKNYADSVSDKKVLTIGHGIKFGVIAGFIVYLVSVGMVSMDTDSVRQRQIDAIEQMRGLMGDDAADKAIEQNAQLTDGQIIGQTAGFGLLSVVFFGIYGLIAGAIFKYDEEDAA
ncbi:MAG: hypothetical protein KDD94_01785 [Calditrichaeota bacterium]|nr:hypothetical protein [Calditrichota bacterium]